VGKSEIAEFRNSKYIYYYCELRKRDATLRKIRSYCNRVNCPHLKTRKKDLSAKKRKPKNKKVFLIQIKEEELN